MNIKDYPADWREISLRIREREGWRCKWCAAKNGDRIKRRDGSPARRNPLAPEPLVVLTVAHLGAPHADGRPGNKHDKMDVRDENLAALCQACHLGYDHADHMRHRKYGRGVNQLLLFAQEVLTP